DKGRLCQVFSNLLINAAKYTNPGGLIVVAFGAQEDVALVRVRDNGIGISPELLPRLFDMFSQASPGSEAAMGGLGVGVAVGCHFVQFHAGSLCVCCVAPGLYSEFVVRLPRCARTGE